MKIQKNLEPPCAKGRAHTKSLMMKAPSCFAAELHYYTELLRP